MLADRLNLQEGNRFQMSTLANKQAILSMSFRVHLTTSIIPLTELKLIPSSYRILSIRLPVIYTVYIRFIVLTVTKNYCSFCVVTSSYLLVLFLVFSTERKKTRNEVRHAASLIPTAEIDLFILQS